MVGWLTSRSGRFPPGKEPVPILQEAVWASGPVWTGAENLASTGIRSPDGPDRSESLYPLSYPAVYNFPVYYKITELVYRLVNETREELIFQNGGTTLSSLRQPSPLRMTLQSARVSYQ